MPRKRHDEGLDDDEAPASPERVLSAEQSALDALDEDAALRPRSFSEFVGQKKIAENLAVYVAAARKRKDALDHVLLSGPPGLGKTTLAFLLAHEMGTEVRVTSGPALERKGDLAGILTSLGKGDILFIDEIHRLQPVVEESLYPAMEDFRIELVTGTGAGARAIPLPIERFTLVGADVVELNPARDPGGTTTAVAAKLVKELAARLLRPSEGPDRTELVVAHGNVIRWLTVKALDVDPASWLVMSIGHASLTVIRVQPDGTPRVLAVGDVGHLPPGLQTGSLGMPARTLAVPSAPAR